MFDAKGMLDALLRGGAQQGHKLSLGPQSTDQPGMQSPPGALREDVPQSPGALEEVLRKVTGGQSGLNDILAKLQQQGGNLPEILGQVLGQATSGVREGAARIDDATGASSYARDAIGKSTGRSPEELLAQLKELTGQQPSGCGRCPCGPECFGPWHQRWPLPCRQCRQGRRSRPHWWPRLQGLSELPGRQARANRAEAITANPAGGDLQGSGFEAGAVTNGSAMLLVRAMIAAAAADGRIDQKEQQRILGGLKQAGLKGTAQQFLAHEINQPATADDLANAVSSPAQAIQVYTAARIAVDPDSEEEHKFLVALADRLSIELPQACQPHRCGGTQHRHLDSYRCCPEMPALRQRTKRL